MLKIAVMVSGGGTNLQALIDAERRGELKNGELSAVISSNADAYALERANRAFIPSYVLRRRDFDSTDAYGDALAEMLGQLDIGLVVLAGFMTVLSPDFCRRFEGRIINIHPSLIPSFCGTGYYGMKVHEGALNRGVKITGATVHFVDEGTDTGPILLQKPVEIMEGDTPEILQRRVMEEAEWILLPEAVDAIANGRVEIKDNRCRILKNRKDSGVS